MSSVLAMFRVQFEGAGVSCVSCPVSLMTALIFQLLSARWRRKTTGLFMASNSMLTVFRSKSPGRMRRESSGRCTIVSFSIVLNVRPCREMEVSRLPSRASMLSLPLSRVLA